MQSWWRLQMHKLYVITRSDISKSQQAVQSGHAVAQFMIDFPNRFENGTLVYLKCDSLIVLEKLKNHISNIGKEISHFLEPDIGNELTSISFMWSKEVDEITKEMRLI